MLVSVLGSGSGGNATYISSNGVAILIDAGFSLKQLEKRVSERGLLIEGIVAIFITHEHTDHWRGAFNLAEKLDVPVFIEEVQLKEIRYKYATKNWCKSFYSDEKHKVYAKTEQKYPCVAKGLTINRFNVSHDTTANNGYIIDDGVSKVGVATDLGYVSKGIYEKLVECNIVVIEANHDLEMLRNGEYPQNIKDRIESIKGHLSNDQCANLVKHLDAKVTKLVILAHVSEDNNTAAKITGAFDDVDLTNGPIIKIATQEYGSDVFFN